MPHFVVWRERALFQLRALANAPPLRPGRSFHYRLLRLRGFRASAAAAGPPADQLNAQRAEKEGGQGHFVACVRAHRAAATGGAAVTRGGRRATVASRPARRAAATAGRGATRSSAG